MLMLRTVRAKLTTLVALSVVVMLATLPVLSWLLHRQLIDEVDDRAAEAERAFQAELDDDIADLTLAARVIATDTDTARAIQAKDAAAARELAAVFLSVYPEIDILVVDGAGHVLAQVGCQHPPEQIAGITELADLAKGGEVRGVAERGCESALDAPPAYVIGEPIKGIGSVVVCLPLNRAYLVNASAKLGLELALAVVATNQKSLVDTTPDFPKEASPSSTGHEPAIVEASDRSWAVARFEPRQLTGKIGQVGMLAALDVTDIRRIVERNLGYALAVLVVAAAVSVMLGWRLASIMSVALKRVNFALKKLEQQEYVHVEAVRTGDELEDLASGFNTMVDGLKERDKLRNTFGKYMTTAVMEHLLSGKVRLGGESITVTILFTDIRSFTTISEKMAAQALVGLLNEYFTEMVGIVIKEEGVVDKYIGDAIMAVFGAPVPKKDDALHAVRAAVRMRQALAHLNERLEERGLAPLRTGIGIHTGEVVAGNIGSEKRMEYTVIGDAVNLASRLETSTKELGVNVLISEDTYQLTKDAIEARPVKEITVKGRHQPAMTYEVLGLKGEPLLEPSESGKMARSKPPPAASA
jgi:adenylate cyclase